jgi:hypothetical protein
VYFKNITIMITVLKFSAHALPPEYHPILQRLRIPLGATSSKYEKDVNTFQDLVIQRLYYRCRQYLPIHVVETICLAVFFEFEPGHKNAAFLR